MVKMILYAFLTSINSEVDAFDQALKFCQNTAVLEYSDLEKEGYRASPHKSAAGNLVWLHDSVIGMSITETSRSCLVSIVYNADREDIETYFQSQGFDPVLEEDTSKPYVDSSYVLYCRRNDSLTKGVRVRYISVSGQGSEINGVSAEVSNLFRCD